MKVTKEDLADLLQFTEYGDMVPEKIKTIAEENGMVIVYGYSDDLIEFDGAISDEAYVSDNTVVRFDKSGVIPEWDSIDKEIEQEVRDYFKRVDETQTSTITALWNRDNYAWTYETEIPHATFQVCEGDHYYCKGIVFELKDVAGF